MPDFDPNAFLSKYGKSGAAKVSIGNSPAAGGIAPPSTAGFDPDAFLAKHGGSAAPREPETIQEMHPDFTAADRFVVKNFSNDDQAAVDYLKQKHPNLDISADKSGQIKARAKDGSDGGKYRVLDPDLSMWGEITHPGEALQDVGDVAWDALSGVGTTAASGASALAALPETLGVGSIPAAMAGGAAASAGLEGARQGIGGLLGVNKEAKLGQVGMAGVGGAAAPLLFGTGASATGIAAKALESGVAPDAVAAAQKGLLGRAASAVGSKMPALAEKVTGLPADAIQGLMENYGMVTGKNPNLVTELGTKTAQEVGNTLRQAKGAAWDTYEKALSGVPGTVDVSAAKDALKSAIARAEAGSSGTDASNELVSELKGAFQKYFVKPVTEETPTASKVATGILDETGAPIMKDVAGSTSSTVQKELTELTPVQAAQLERQLAELGDASKLGAIKGGVGNRFGAGMSANDKAVAGAAMDAKKALSATLSDALPPEAQAAKAAYGQVANMEKAAKPLFKNPDTAFKTLRNLGRPANRAKQELLNQMDQTLGTSVIPASRAASAVNTFSKPGIMPLSSGGVTSTTRAGVLGALGAGAGDMVDKYGGGEGHRGATVGGALGAMLGSPAAMRQFIRMGLAGQGAAAAVPNFVAPAVANTAWGAINQ